MDLSFELDILNDHIDSYKNIDPRDFSQFCEDLEFLESYADQEFYFDEAVDDPRVNATRRNDQIKDNTKITTRDALKVYDTVTTAGGTFIGGLWKLFMKVVGIIAKSISFIITWIGKGMNGISSLISKIGKIPQNIRDKIKGNVRLYITANDIEMLYNNSLLSKIDTFVAILSDLTKGDFWGTTFHPRPGKKILISKTDFKLCKDLKRIYNDVHAIKFSETLIEMKNAEVVSIYFGDSDVIQFKDLDNNDHQCNYYEALKQLAVDLSRHRDTLNVLQKDFSAKMRETKDNGNFASLRSKEQRMINDTMQMISKVMAIVGNATKCILQDVKTMDKIVSKLGTNNQP